MNTNNSLPYRINNLLYLIGFLLIAMLAQHTWRPLSAALNRMAEQATTRQAFQPQAEAPALLLLQADALVLPMQNGAAQVMARVRDAKGTPVAGVTVQFQSNLGSLNPASAVTNADGAAVSTFHASGAPGRALVTATASGLASEAAIQLVNPTISAASNVLAVEFGATMLTPGQAVAISAVLRDGAGQPVAGELVSLFGSLGEVIPASAMSDGNGRVTASYRAGQGAGSGMITALAGVASKSVAFQVAGQGGPGQSSFKAYLPVISR